VADALAADSAQVVLTGSSGERELTAAVAAEMERSALDLAGRLSLGGLTGLLARCTLVVGNDTGPLHLARAVGAPTVAAYWAGNLLTAGPVGRARHRAPVACTMRCPTCGASALERRCPHDVSFVTSIMVQEMLSEARDLLSTSAPPRSKEGRGGGSA
jgi:ADP-heptose:LPS heptosyltransferase